MLYFNKELNNAFSLAPFQPYWDCHLWDGAPGICILSVLGVSLMDSCPGCLWLWSSRIWEHTWSFRVIILHHSSSSHWGFHSQGVPGQIFKRKKWLAPLLRGSWKAFQSRLSLHYSWESKKGELSRSTWGWATVQATVDRSWGSPLPLIALSY